jgi:hypothetical protein
MFVKLLTLLISNVCNSFSVLFCCRSLALKCGLKGEIGQNEDLVPANALEPSKQDRVCLHRPRKASVRAHLRLSTRPAIEHTPHHPVIPVLP